MTAADITAGEEASGHSFVGTRGRRRLLNAAGVLAVVGLMAYALYSQYVVGLEACPLCIFQRVAMIALGVVFLAAALHAPRGLGARGYAFVGLLTALTGAGISAWHVRLQNLPPAEVPACGPGLDYMLDAFPLSEAVRMVFTGSGECAEVNWSFLGLSMPAWVLVWFVLLGALVTAANWTRVTR
ncbi:MAG: disulfide bond formation protein B [Gammaproteobacteria bacterium]|nr:disulfide bond formation protein B [Gammaproteobacteria bacterium]